MKLATCAVCLRWGLYQAGTATADVAPMMLSFGRKDDGLTDVWLWLQCFMRLLQGGAE